MSRINDIVFISNGGYPFLKTFPVSNDFNIERYNKRKAELNYRRNLLTYSCGVDSDVNANIDQVMSLINTLTQNRLDTIGQVCLLGRSQGCALALGLAAELNSKGFNDLTFVGLSDVPMWDVGRKPSVRWVGNFMPMNHPARSGARAPTPTIMQQLLGSSVDPEARQAFLKLDTAINVKKTGTKINLYQTQGNHMKWSNTANRWMWTSDLSEGEVHGEVDGFWNQAFNVTPAASYSGDLALHVSLNCGEHWKDMCNAASAQFAELPDQPLP